MLSAINGLDELRGAGPRGAIAVRSTFVLTTCFLRTFRKAFKEDLGVSSEQCTNTIWALHVRG